MEIVSFSDALGKPQVRKRVLESMVKGSVLVYPTDTIYGIGCNATLVSSVDKVREAKGRDAGKQFSVIAPGKEWISRNAALSKMNLDLADKLLPGPYTIIVAAGKGAPKAVVSEEGSIGIRLPRHPFTRLVEEAGVPFVTTSVNASGGKPATCLEEIPGEMKTFIDMALDAGVVDGQASRIFDFRTDDVKTMRRR